LSPIGSLLLVKFIEVATAEPKFEEPPAIKIVTIYYKQTNKIISQSQKTASVCISLSKQKKKYDFSFCSEGACMNINTISMFLNPIQTAH
jgi:hypothetical protein